jgi:AraC-like DNA-binding protein
MAEIRASLQTSAHPPRQPVDRIRAASLQGFASLVAELGGQPEHLLRGRALSTPDLADGESPVPYSAVIGLLEEAATALACPDFGLLLSRRQHIDVLGPAAMIMRYSETVGEALEAISTWLFVHTPAAGIGLSDVGGDDILLTYEVLLPGLRGRRQIIDLSLGLAQSHLEMLLGERFRARQVRLGYRRPASTAALRSRFGPALVFDSALSAIAVPKAALQRPVPTANANYRRVVLDYLHNQRLDRGRSVTRRVRQLVGQLLPTGRMSLEAVAEVLGTSPRTLQRRLVAEGAGFRRLVDDERRARVADYLLDTDAPLARIAGMLGYSDQSAFNKAFTRWYGIAPGQWREGHAGPARSAGPG